MHTGETLAAAPPARPLRQSRLGGLSLFLALAGVAIALAVMALALGERIDLSDENHLLGLFAALLAVFAVSTCGLVLGLAGLLRRSRKRHLAFLLLAEALAGFRERKRDWTCGGTATCGKIGEGAIL